MTAVATTVAAAITTDVAVATTAVVAITITDAMVAVATTAAAAITTTDAVAAVAITIAVAAATTLTTHTTPNNMRCSALLPMAAVAAAVATVIATNGFYKGRRTERCAVIYCTVILKLIKTACQSRSGMV